MLIKAAQHRLSSAAVLIIVLLCAVINDRINHGNGGGRGAFLAATEAYPVQAVDFHHCQNATDKSVSGPTYITHPNCCQPLPKNGTVNFTLARYPTPPPGAERVRVAAHRATAEHVAKYLKAYELLRALPESDPRSWQAQANMHCAMCNGAYKQAGINASGSVPMQVHFSWLFLPWHRWYLYFHERILGHLLGDPSFSLVFWNWDDLSGDGGNFMPSMFLTNGSSLYDAKRNYACYPPTIVTLVPGTNASTDEEIVQQNLNAMYRTMVAASTPEIFFGGACRVGTDLSNSSVVHAPLGGSLENTPHGAVHNWTGAQDNPLAEDMGTFSTAARDPLFFTHHANLDRLWHVWTTLPGGNRVPYNDTDFLDAEFSFYDEHATLVKVKVRDALNMTNFGYRYEERPTDALWLNFTPTAQTNSSAVPKALSKGVPIIEDASVTSDSSVYSLGSTFVAIVNRSVDVNTTSSEILEIQGIRVERTKFVHLNVFLNMPDVGPDTKTSSAEYVGSFNIVPTSSDNGRSIFVNAKFEIRDILVRIGLTQENSVVVSVVVNPSDVDITIKGMKIISE